MTDQRTNKPSQDATRVTVSHVSLFIQQAMFMEACGQTIGEFNPDQFVMYLRLIREESNELRDALERGNWTAVFDALLDLHAVIAGAGLSIGFPMSNGWREVVRSNMSKRDPETGKVRKRVDGKVLKPASYMPPDLAGVLSSEAWAPPAGVNSAEIFRKALAAFTGESSD